MQHSLRARLGALMGSKEGEEAPHPSAPSCCISFAEVM
jgi:hypothetical protein